MKKWIYYSFVWIIMVSMNLFLSACGGGDDGNDTTKTGTIVITTNRSDASFSVDGPGGHFDTSTHPLGKENTMSISNMPEGNYTVTFNNIADCLTTPQQDSGYLNAGQVLTLKGDYGGCSTGTIKVYTNNQYASFTITGENKNLNGNSVDWEQTNVDTGGYTITYHSISGYKTPAAVTKTLTKSSVLIFAGNYIPENAPAGTGSITVTTNHENAAYVIEGTASFVGIEKYFHFDSVPVGDYTITFKPISGYQSPASKTIKVSFGQNVSVDGLYTSTITVPATEFEGKWAQAPYYDNTTGGWNQEILTLNNFNFNSTTNLFYEQGLTILIGKVEALGTVTIGKDLVTPAGAKEVDMKFSSIKFTPLHDSFAQALNKAIYLGYTDWKKDIAKDVSGKEGMPTAGTTSYNIVKLDGNTLYLGDTKANCEDGTTPLTRPTCWEKEPFTKIINIAGSLIGSWVSRDTSSGNTVVITFLDDTHFIFAQDGNNNDPTGHDGIETGTYTWNSTTGAFTANVIVDTNGEWGFSDMGLMTISVSGNILTLSDNNGFTRTIIKVQ
ncbi:MAG: hypothetical protein HQK76_19360 [Desulfobacterales bacterium]|nr:hypothetical protein [Desulfobacterales bacterium]